MLPIALSLAAEPLYSMVDTYAVGKRMGSRALSAFSLAERVFVIGCVSKRREGVCLVAWWGRKAGRHNLPTPSFSIQPSPPGANNTTNERTHQHHTASSSSTSPLPRPPRPLWPASARWGRRTWHFTSSSAWVRIVCRRKCVCLYVHVCVCVCLSPMNRANLVLPLAFRLGACSFFSRVCVWSRVESRAAAFNHDTSDTSSPSLSLNPPPITRINTPGVGVALLGIGLIPMLQRLARPTISLLSGGADGLMGKSVFASGVEYYCARVKIIEIKRRE